MGEITVEDANHWRHAGDLPGEFNAMPKFAKANAASFFVTPVGSFMMDVAIVACARTVVAAAME